MTDGRRKRARAAARKDIAGFDVWLPALAAIVAAIVLLFPAKADAPPRSIYDAERFAMTEAERTALEEQAALGAHLAAATRAAAHRRISAAAAHVEVHVLPPLAEIAHPVALSAASTADLHVITSRPVFAAERTGGTPSPGWARLAMALAIAAMLGGALYMLDRTWRRTGRSAHAGEPAAA